MKSQRNHIHVFLVLSCLLGFFHTVVSGHAGSGERPTKAPESNWLIKEPFSGGPEFAKTLSQECLGLLERNQVMLLERALSFYEWSDQIQKGWFGNLTEVDGQYYRQLADNTLMTIMGGLTPNLVLDFSDGASRPDPEAIIPYDLASQSMLLQINLGDGPTSFRSQLFDMNRERYIAPYGIQVASTGTTYVLLRARGVPVGLSKTGVSFTKEEDTEPFGWHAITLDVAKLGTLSIKITDENGEPTHALLRIESKENGNLWPLDSPHDFNSLHHDITGPALYMPPGLNIKGPDSSLRITLPGRGRQYCWLVDSQTDVMIAPGEWTVDVIRGIEYEPWNQTVTVESGEWTDLAVTTSRWVDMKSKGWISGDDHVHSRLRSSKDASTLIALSKAMDVHITNILEMGDPQRTYFTQRGFGPEFRVQDDGYWLIPGQEDPRSVIGHHIGMNLESLARDIDNYLRTDWVAQEVHSQGGLFGQTHVGQNACFAHRGMAIIVPHELYDFCSIMQQGLGTELWYDFLDLGYRLPASAGSDMPYAGVTGDVRLYVHHASDKQFTPDDWFDGLKLGRTFTTNGPMIDFSVNGQLPGSVLIIEDNTPLMIKARAWGYEGRSAPVSLQVVSLSEPVETVLATQDTDTELSLEFDLEPGEGQWIAARAWGRDNSAAHTSPIYVQRKGKRHWNKERARSIIERQLAVLEEVEQEIVKVEEMEANGNLNNLDFGSLGIYRERESLRDLLASSQSLYEELLVELEDETQ